VTLPTLTVDSSLARHRGGGQEIRILYLGRGHTGGDRFVHLPREAVDVSAFVGALPGLRAGLSPVAAQRAYDLATGRAQ
jgi:hypothetical protein